MARKLAVALDQAVALGVGLEMVGGLDERDAGLLGEQRRPRGGRTRDGC